MERFSLLLALCVGNSPVTGEFLPQRPVTWSFDVYFDLHLNTNDLRRDHAHYDITTNVIMKACAVWLHMPLSHCRECCLRTNTNWHSLRIAQHRFDSNYFVLVRCHFRISSQPNTNVLKCSKHSYWPCESILFVLRRIAWPNVVSIRVSSYWFVSHHCTFVSIRCTFALGFAACLRWLSTLQYDAQRSYCRIGSCRFLLVPIVFLSHHSAIVLILHHHRTASYCIMSPSCCILLHLTAIVSIRVWFVSDSHWFANKHRIKSFWFGIEVDPVRTPNF